MMVMKIVTHGCENIYIAFRAWGNLNYVRLIKDMLRIRNYIYVKQYHVIIQSYPNINGWFKVSLKLGYEWMITSRIKFWM